MLWSTRTAALGLSVISVALIGCQGLHLGSGRGGGGTLREALTFHASFDHGTDADFALADPWIYHAPGMDKWSEAQPGLPAEQPQVAVGEGRYGGALHFAERTGDVVFYRGGRNVPWKDRDWSGSVSFWLRTDLEALPEGFCDPIQVTPRGWNDAAFFVEFERRPEETVFRLGAYSDFKIWNPLNREWADIPPGERPVVTVSGPPFMGDHWTHVVFTWSRLNTGEPTGQAVLYLDGTQVGALVDRRLSFTWDPAETRVLLGVGFVGWIDDVSVFNRALDASEVRQLRALPGGIHSLH